MQQMLRERFGLSPNLGNRRGFPESAFARWPQRMEERRRTPLGVQQSSLGIRVQSQG